MVALVLFWAGLLSAVLIAIGSYFSKGEDARGWAFFPLYLLLAAAVARYLGM